MILHTLREKGFFHLLSVKFLGQFLGFGSTLLVAKFLAPAELGDIRVIQTYAGLLTLLAGFGLGTAVLKLCSEGHGDEANAATLRHALARAIGTTLAVLAGLYLASWAGFLSLAHVSGWLLIYALAIPFIVSGDLFVIFLQATKRVKEMARAQALVRLQSFVVLVAATWLWGFPGFIWASVVAFAIGMLPPLIQVWPTLSMRVRAIAPGDLSHLALFSLLANFVSAIGQQADILLLDRFVGDRAEIGYYSLATILILAATQVTATVQSIVTPYFSERGHDKGWFLPTLLKTQLRMVALSLGVAIALNAVAWVALPWIYGPAYQSTLSYLAVLSIKYVIWSSYAIVGVALLGLGMVRYNLMVVLVSTPIGLALTYIFLQRYGMPGVAWAQVLATLVSFGLVGWIVRLALRRLDPPAGRQIDSSLV